MCERKESREKGLGFGFSVLVELKGRDKQHERKGKERKGKERKEGYRR